jgi:membrane-bound lytic murein transglycosylase A
MTFPLRLLVADFKSLPGWAEDDHLAAFRAFCVSASVIATGNKSDPDIGAVCRAGLDAAAEISTPSAARAFFERHFRALRVEHQGPPGLLTGYYEPVIDGSLVATSKFAVPIYRRPADLENVVAESERGAKSGSGPTHLRRTANGVEPYATRRQIEAGALANLGLELCYLGDAVETFFLHVQGSGVIALPDGRQMRITYDGKNGHPYTSVGRTLVEDGTFKAHEITLQSLGDWLRADPGRARPILWRNESFVFFRELQADSAIGVLGSPLHPGRSLAVDTAFHALGLPIYVSSPGMTHVAPGGFNRLMIAHDVGSAIKGPERGDIYFGTGMEALALAGITKHAGSFTVLQPVAMP